MFNLHKKKRLKARIKEVSFDERKRKRDKNFKKGNF